MDWRDVWTRHRVVVVLGSGGVGKTTLAASVALQAAREGKRVLALTIDPAKRLANSLGLDRMRTEAQEVPSELFEQHGLRCEGSLSAMMLDTKGTFDALVMRHAATAELAERVFSNRLYQYVSGSLAGTTEYMAMEKLHEVRNSERWDLVVLDTPPTADALNFLDAPERLIGLIDSPATQWFVQAFDQTRRLSLSVLGKSAAFLLRGLSRFTGAAFLDTIAAFVTDLNTLFAGFRRRAEAVSAELRGQEVTFVIVTRPDPAAIDEALFLHDRLTDMEMRASAFVMNGVHPRWTSRPLSTSELTELLRDAGSAANGTDEVTLARALEQASQDHQRQAEADHVHVRRLEARRGQLAYAEIPAFDEDIHDLTGLAAMGANLTSSSPTNPREDVRGHA